jgi:hypothetical protein
MCVSGRPLRAVKLSPGKRSKRAMLGVEAALALELGRQDEDAHA